MTLSLSLSLSFLTILLFSADPHSLSSPLIGVVGDPSPHAEVCSRYSSSCSSCVSSSICVWRCSPLLGGWSSGRCIPSINHTADHQCATPFLCDSAVTQEDCDVLDDWMYRCGLFQWLVAMMAASMWIVRAVSVDSSPSGATQMPTLSLSPSSLHDLTEWEYMMFVSFMTIQIIFSMMIVWKVLAWIRRCCCRGRLVCLDTDSRSVRSVPVSVTDATHQQAQDARMTSSHMKANNRPVPTVNGTENGVGPAGGPRSRPFRPSLPPLTFVSFLAVAACLSISIPTPVSAYCYWLDSCSECVSGREYCTWVWSPLVGDGIASGRCVSIERGWEMGCVTPWFCERALFPRNVTCPVDTGWITAMSHGGSSSFISGTERELWRTLIAATRHRHRHRHQCRLVGSYSWCSLGWSSPSFSCGNSSDGYAEE